MDVKTACNEMASNKKHLTCAISMLSTMAKAQ